MTPDERSALVEIMAGASYDEQARAHGMRPAWGTASHEYRRIVQQDIQAAIAAAEAAGWVIERKP